MLANCRRSLTATILVLASLLPAVAIAHPGHASDSLLAGFVHPLTGLDHVLVIAAVSAWAAQLRLQSRMVVLAALAVAVPLGALLPIVPASTAWLEIALALTVVGSGLLLALGRKLPLAAAGTLAGGFALLHGFAHGLEGPRDALAYVPGLAMATVALTAGASLLAGKLLAQGRHNWLQVAGIASVLSGAFMLV
ncbi:MAG: HupE/UreJ family protein [Steroidobacteraceae bacterium]